MSLTGPGIPPDLIKPVTTIFPKILSFGFVMKLPFDLHFGLCLLGTLSTIFSQPASGQEPLHNELFHVPPLQHRVSGNAKTGPNILFIMSDDQGKLFICKCCTCHPKPFAYSRFAHEINGGNAERAKAFS